MNNSLHVLSGEFFCGDFTLRLHVLILLVILVNLWVQLYLIYKIWVRIPKSLFWSVV
jgi:hypothetical protein